MSDETDDVRCCRDFYWTSLILVRNLFDSPGFVCRVIPLAFGLAKTSCGLYYYLNTVRLSRRHGPHSQAILDKIDNDRIHNDKRRFAVHE